MDNIITILWLPLIQQDVRGGHAIRVQTTLVPLLPPSLQELLVKI